MALAARRSMLPHRGDRAAPDGARAAVFLLDRKHSGAFPMQRGDASQAGDVCGHNVVIATLPVGQVKKYFPNLWFGLLVGVPTLTHRKRPPDNRRTRIWYGPIRSGSLELKKVLELSDRVQNHADTGEEGTTCHTCGKNSAILKNCARCSLFWDCGKAVDWKERGHKDDCKLLKDPDLQGLFRLEWGNFEDYQKFS
ncbi:kinesin light chain 1 [Emericellopsis cladophorae]|uniref:Kinesin light chain 1 n=1 Tax=Emericellopsis cladophorae TaxID=2686198 RepID=A0A9P9XTN1_9HYPO|nr:kinesin light chain 1 [Emericellopsis cladophorae]KAI6777646.1 kinesin light chain 1 [Emericellopsis cladophorae]